MLILKKKKIRNNYRKIGKKKDNDVDASITQLEHNNNKYGVLAFIKGYVRDGGNQKRSIMCQEHGKNKVAWQKHNEFVLRAYCVRSMGE